MASAKERLRAKRSECERERAIRSVGKREGSMCKQKGACASERKAIASKGDVVQVRGNECERERASMCER